MCQSLEATVELIQRASWLEDIYRLPPDTSDNDEARPRTTQPSQQGFQSSQVIDLGTPSDSEEDGVVSSSIPLVPTQIKESKSQERGTQAHILTPDPAIVRTCQTAESASACTPVGVRSNAALGDAPEQASIFTVSQWSWAVLEDTQDRKRSVSKAIYELSKSDREMLRQRLRMVGRAHMVREIPACVGMFLRGSKRMPGILPQDLPKVIIVTRLFLCFWLCGNYMQRRASKHDLKELVDCLQGRLSDPALFCDYVATVFYTTFSEEALKYPAKPPCVDIIEISDDDEVNPQLLIQTQR